MRRPQLPPCERAELLADIVDLLSGGDRNTRTVAEWVGVSRQSALIYLRGLVAAGRARHVEVVRLAGGWTSHVWGAA